MLLSPNSFFKFHYHSPTNIKLPCITLDGEVVHYIDDLNEFYKYLGYTVDVAKAGNVADEFFWEVYFKNNDISCRSCYQLHLINYLLQHCPGFANKYGNQIDEITASHVEVVSKCSVSNCPVESFSK